MVKLKYEEMHLSQSVPPMPCLHVHVPEDMEQSSATSVPTGLQPQAVEHSKKTINI